MEVSPSAPGPAAPTAPGSHGGRRPIARSPTRSWTSGLSDTSPVSSDPRRPAPGLPGALRFRQSARSSRWLPAAWPSETLASSLASGCVASRNARLRDPGRPRPRHRIIARLYNVGVGGILAQHLAKCCPCRPLQARLTALCEPCGTPPVALAGCDLRRRPARCTSHGPRLDRRAVPHRGPPLAVCTAPLRRAASGHACDSAAASRLPSATVPRVLRFGPAFTGPPVEVTTSSTVAQVPVLARPFAQPRTPPAARPVSSTPCVSLFPRWRRDAPGGLVIQTCTKVSQNPLKTASNHLK